MASVEAEKTFPGEPDKQEGFDAGVRHALRFLDEQMNGYSYYSTIDFDKGYVHALELAIDLLKMDLEPSDGVH